MYKFYLKKILLPVTPEKVTFSINGANKTMTLINYGEVNQIKSSKLTDIKFEALLPMIQDYPFAQYKGNEFKSADYYLDKLEDLKNKELAFCFKIIRTAPNGTVLFDTNMKVTLEDYQIVESASQGLDIKVSINLKQWKPHGTERLKKDIPETYKVKKNDTLYKIAKKELNDGTKWKKLLKLNKKVLEKAAKKHGKGVPAKADKLYKGTIIKLK